MFADNQRISGIQMERQFFLAYLGPVILWIAPLLPGRHGIFGILTGSVLLCIWVFFLLRQSHVCRYPEKYWGKFMSWVITLVYESYLILTGGWLAASIGKFLQEYMIQGIPGWLLVALVVLTALCGNATLQTRGRFAQTAWPVVGGIVFLMLLLAAFQGQGGYGQEVQLQQNMANGTSMVIQEEPTWNRDMIFQTGRNAVMFVSALLGIVLIPFAQPEYDSVAKSADHTGILFKIIGKTVLCTGAIIVLLQAVYGNAGAEILKYPVLNLMAGVRIPGGFIRRMDMIFLAFLLFSLLFSLGSVFFYSNCIVSRVRGKKDRGILGSVPAAVLCFILGTVEFSGWSLIQDYINIVFCIYLPLFLALTFCNALLRRRPYGKQKKQV
ncbi:MAG: GerAB/ArcD/ProY family transporter [Oliverpabstia sp.]